VSGEVRTTCPYCGVGCGVVAELVGGVPRIAGDPLHPANHGALCSKGSALDETLGLENRLLHPRMLGADASWECALDYVGRRLNEIMGAHGPESVALYVSGQLLTEDYYVANKLMKGYLGTANIDTNSRLCMASAVAAHIRAFGEDLVPVSYEDLEIADLVVLVGSNLAWCHPVLYQRLMRAKQRRSSLRLVVIDPRRTPTCDLADLHLPLRAGTDAVLFNGLLSWLAQHSAEDQEFVSRHTRGAAQALLVAHNTAGELPAVARRCGLEAAALRRFYDWFTTTGKAVTVFSQGINQSSSGTDKANSIINAHLFTGRIGKPGMGPFSITGQPNAMGGREVGGLATTLAAHMSLDNDKHRRLVQGFWGSPKIAARPGLKAVDMFEAVYRGEIKALWILGTNPVVSMPNADRAREALRRCELVVVSDVVAGNDTTALAHALFPALAWGEKDGTVTNSDRHISRQRSFLPPPGTARPDWWALCQVARRLGFGAAFDYTTAAQIFDEHTRLTSIGAQAQRALDLSGLAGLGEAGYERLQPVQWPVRARRSPDSDEHTPRQIGDERLLSNGRFAHADGRARLVPIKPTPPRFACDEEYPFILNTGRVRDQWHSMTRSGRSPRLSAHRPEPYVEVHPSDARALGLRQGALARIVSRWGSMVGRVVTIAEAPRGAVFAPIHWSGTNSSSGRVGAVVNPSVDPLSGEPEFKSTPVRVEPFVASWYGFILTRSDPCLREVGWWAFAQNAGFRSYELAGRSIPLRWHVWARAALAAGPANADFIDYEDANGGTYRAALLCEERLEAYVAVSRSSHKFERSWLADLFTRNRLSLAERAALLAAKPLNPDADAGPIVCACFGVGRKRIEAAIEQGAREIGTIGGLLKAGTNCGSCVPEIRHLIAHGEKA
jgi:assimilatory nitrate reductase catalytic subunit